MKRELPLGITAVVGFLFLVQYFFKIAILKSMTDELTDWGTIVSAFAALLAAAGLYKIHLEKIARRKGPWEMSIVLVLVMTAFIIFGVFLGQKSAPYLFLSNQVLVPLSAAIFSLLIFYIGSAAFRAFRLRNLEAGLLLGSGFLVMLGRAPIGEVVWKKFPVIADWLMKWPNLAGNRGVLIGASIGSIAIGLRILVGIDRGHLGQD